MNIPDKTLVIRFSSIGDIILASPLLRVLRYRFPDSQIDFVTRTEYSDLVRFNLNVNCTFSFDATDGLLGLVRLGKRLREEGYDLVIDIHNSIRSRILRWVVRAPHTVVVDKRVTARTLLVRFKKNVYTDSVPVADRYVETLKPFGLLPDGVGPELFVPDEVRFRIRARFAPLHLERTRKVIGICPSAKHATKRWPADRYADAALRFAKELNARVLLFGGPEDQKLCAGIAETVNEAIGGEFVLSFAGRLSLLETAAAMQHCDVILTNDTGLMHMASATQRPLVALFGSTVKEFGFFPYEERSAVLEVQGLHCRPCSHVGRSKCPQKHFRCMLDTSVDQVVEAVRRFALPA